jgi:hypothetical protein
MAGADRGRYNERVDALRRDDLERARRLSPAERLRLALETADAGIALKRSALRVRHPDESESEIDARLRRWLRRQDA